QCALCCILRICHPSYCSPITPAPIPLWPSSLCNPSTPGPAPLQPHHPSTHPTVLDEGQQALAARSDYNFDHPDAFDFELLVSVLRKLKKGKSVKVPVYDFTTHSRRREWVRKTVYGANVIVFEGILAFANKELLKLLDMKVFVDTDSDIRLVRRLQRDIMERGRDIVGVIKQYHKFVKPAFEQYIEPTVQLADIVVPRGRGVLVPRGGDVVVPRGCGGRSPSGRARRAAPGTGRAHRLAHRVVRRARRRHGGRCVGYLGHIGHVGTKQSAARVQAGLPAAAAVG
uniref:uridine/cytidine kinase n=1 Tax=Nothoprocta perdicaria TaxID=30464 RepID=A0A8C6ZJA9_NOTPE